MRAVRRWRVDREQSLGGEPDAAVAASVGLEPAAVERLFRLLAIAKYDERYVIPRAHTEVAGGMAERQGASGISGAAVTCVVSMNMASASSASRSISATGTSRVCGS